MTWGITFLPSAGTAADDGVHIPLSDLPGITSAELNTGSDPAAERKVAYAILNALAVNFPSTAPLGMLVSRSTPAGAAIDRINQSFTVTNQYVINQATNENSLIPLPAGGAGALNILDIFPLASVIMSGNAVPAGIFVTEAYLQANGFTGVVSTILDDLRGFIDALLLSMVRDLTASAALTAKTRSIPAGFTPPTNFTGDSAITGLTADDLAYSSFYSLTYTLGFQLALNQSTQTFDLAA